MKTYSSVQTFFMFKEGLTEDDSPGINWLMVVDKGEAIRFDDKKTLFALATVDLTKDVDWDQLEEMRVSEQTAEAIKTLGLSREETDRYWNNLGEIGGEATWFYRWRYKLLKGLAWLPDKVF